MAMAFHTWKPLFSDTATLLKALADCKLNTGSEASCKQKQKRAKPRTGEYTAQRQ